MLDQNFGFSLGRAVDTGLLPFIPDEADRKKVAGKVKEFLKNRLVNLQTEAGYAREAVNAAIAVNYDDIPDVVSRIRALDELRQQPDFEPLAVTFKRVGNILKKIEPGRSVSINPDLFEEPAEKTLFNTCKNIQKTVESLIDKGDYDNALKNIASLRPDVDKFFDDVMVMTLNEAVKLNRIALLQNVSGLFKDIADFTKI
jgi:glycyl-tRNA synthetase beta chain